MNVKFGGETVAPLKKQFCRNLASRNRLKIFLRFGKNDFEKKNVTNA